MEKVVAELYNTIHSIPNDKPEITVKMLDIPDQYNDDDGFYRSWAKLSKPMKINRLVQYSHRAAKELALTDDSAQSLRSLLIHAANMDSLNSNDTVDYDSDYAIITGLRDLRMKEDNTWYLSYAFSGLKAQNLLIAEKLKVPSELKSFFINIRKPQQQLEQLPVKTMDQLKRKVVAKKRS